MAMTSAEKSKRWRAKNTEWKIRQRDRLNAARAANPQKFKDYNRNNRQKFKEQVLRMYNFSSAESVRCTHCTESRLDALTIDHIANNGSTHRKLVGSDSFYRKLHNEGYPSGFQVLCYNCNIAKYLNTLKPSDTQPAKRNRKYRLRVKREFMALLGGQCKICGIDNLDLLTVHHPLNNGADHRREIAAGQRGSTFYRNVMRSGDISNLECRCFSCNCAEPRTA